MKTPTTRTRIDYTQIAAQLNYSALDQKLEQLRTLQPPKKRKKIGDILAPVESRLRELHEKGWSHEQLAKELSEFGLPVKPTALRDYLRPKNAKTRRRGSRKTDTTLSDKN